MKKISIIIILVCLSISTLSFSADIYIAQNAAGANNGTSCSNAYAWSAFSSAGNWSAGNTLHVCGTVSFSAGVNAITSRGSGSSGNPITIKFEDNAVLTSPAWSSNPGAIKIEHNYINVDGGTNGTINATLNGTIGQTCPGGTCAYQTQGFGIIVSGSYCTITKMNINNLQIHVSNVNDGGFYTATGIYSTGSNNIISYNIINHAECAVEFSGNNTEVKNNTSNYINRHIKFGAVNNSSVHDNNMGHSYNWDEPNNYYHHNGIHVFGDGTSSNVKIYNNYFYGFSSKAPSATGHMTSFGIFLNPEGGSGMSMDGYKIFNNLFIQSYDPINYTGNGNIVLGAGGNTYFSNLVVVNNTIIDNGSGGIGINNRDLNGIAVIKNNILRKDAGTYVSLYGAQRPWADLSLIDYNIYSGNANTWSNQVGAIYSFSEWSTVGSYPAGECGFDQHGSKPSTSSLNLNSDGTLGSGSSAIGSGVNLTSLGITELNLDKNGVARPTSGAWDIGAYQYDTSVGDTTAPVVTITSPTSSATYSTSSSTINISGTASDAGGVSSVTWANDRGGSGTCTGTTSWSQSNITLYYGGVNVITISARDAANNIGTDTLTVSYPPPDLDPPVISNPLPSGAQVCSANPLPSTLRITTDENATCKYGTSNVVYDSLPNTFATTGTTAHSQVINLNCGNSYTYYTRCKDVYDNKSTAATTISFSISASDTTPPSIVGYSPTSQQACTQDPKPIVMQVQTTENATCKYGTADLSYASLPSTFSSTGGTSHSQSINKSCGGVAANYYVRCQDGVGNAMVSSQNIQLSAPVPAMKGQGVVAGGVR